jgi:predicted RNase H-like HicB family nuclease
MSGQEVVEMSYRVVIERDESDRWFARIPSVPGCHTHGRTLEQVRRRIREALSLWVDDARRAKLLFDVRLPREIKREIRVAHGTRVRSLRAQREASEAISRAVGDLTRAGLSFRDAADLLGLSHQRVHQLASAHPEKRRESGRRTARSA